MGYGIRHDGNNNREDIIDPYGGAFKVTRGLSTKFADRVLSMPISEAGLTGFANGLALAGMRPWAEIMFGDFVTLAFDQLVNHAGKFHHMYNRQVNCPLVLRMAIGGGRGYGPTHSQCLEKHLCGVDNIRVIALNSWLEPERMLAPLLSIEHPAVVLEHKLDYGRRIGMPAWSGYVAEFHDVDHPAICLRPESNPATVTLATYGGMASVIADILPSVMEKTGTVCEVVNLSRLSPLDFLPVVDSVSRTRNLVVVEEGGTPYGIGAEVISSVMESGAPVHWARRIGAAAVPIPSPPELENQCIPSASSLLKHLSTLLLSCPPTS